jgi:hypothetical protein
MPDGRSGRVEHGVQIGAVSTASLAMAGQRAGGVLDRLTVSSMQEQARNNEPNY